MFTFNLFRVYRQSEGTFIGICELDTQRNKDTHTFRLLGIGWYKSIITKKYKFIFELWYNNMDYYNDREF